MFVDILVHFPILQFNSVLPPVSFLITLFHSIFISLSTKRELCFLNLGNFTISAYKVLFFAQKQYKFFIGDFKVAGFPQSLYNVIILSCHTMLLNAS